MWQANPTVVEGRIQDQLAALRRYSFSNHTSLRVLHHFDYDPNGVAALEKYLADSSRTSRVALEKMAGGMSQLPPPYLSYQASILAGQLHHFGINKRGPLFGFNRYEGTELHREVQRRLRGHEALRFMFCEKADVLLATGAETLSIAALPDQTPKEYAEGSLGAAVKNGPWGKGSQGAQRLSFLDRIFERAAQAAESLADMKHLPRDYHLSFEPDIPDLARVATTDDIVDSHLADLVKEAERLANRDLSVLRKKSALYPRLFSLQLFMGRSLQFSNIPLRIGEYLFEDVMKDFDAVASGHLQRVIYNEKIGAMLARVGTHIQNFHMPPIIPCALLLFGGATLLSS